MELKGHMQRIDKLLGKDYEIRLFRDLPLPFQCAIVYYMAIDGCAWDCGALGDAESSDEVKALMPSTMNLYISKHGDSKWGVAYLSADRIKSAILSDPDIASEFSTWEDYSRWYMAAGDVELHANTDRWPSILANDGDETLQDGNHRLHSYLHLGHADVPLVFFPSPHHLTEVKTFDLHKRNAKKNRP